MEFDVCINHAVSYEISDRLGKPVDKNKTTCYQINGRFGLKRGYQNCYCRYF